MLKCHPYRAIMWCMMVHPHSMEDIHTAGAMLLPTDSNIYKHAQRRRLFILLSAFWLSKSGKAPTRDYAGIVCRAAAVPLCILRLEAFPMPKLKSRWHTAASGWRQPARKDNHPAEWRLAMVNMLERACKAMLPRTCFHKPLRDKKHMCVCVSDSCCCCWLEAIFP